MSSEMISTVRYLFGLAVWTIGIAALLLGPPVGVAWIFIAFPDLVLHPLAYLLFAPAITFYIVCCYKVYRWVFDF